MMNINMLYQLADLLKDAADKRVENIQLKEKIKHDVVYMVDQKIVLVIYMRIVWDFMMKMEINYPMKINIHLKYISNMCDKCGHVVFLPYNLNIPNIIY